MTYEAYRVVVVPFPFSDKKVAKRRPALVLSNHETFNAPSGHSLMAMITSVENPAWPLDVAIQDQAAAGLPHPSKVRMKLFTLDNRLILRPLGTLSERDRRRIRRSVKTLLNV